MEAFVSSDGWNVAFCNLSLILVSWVEASTASSQSWRSVNHNTVVSLANVRSYLSVVSLCALLQWLMLTLVRVSRRPTMWHAQPALCPTSREARGKHYLATPGRVPIGWARRRVGGALTNVLRLPLRWLLMCGSDVWTCFFFFVEGIIGDSNEYYR